MSPELLFIDAHLEMANIFIYFQLSDANNALIRTGWRYMVTPIIQTIFHTWISKFQNVQKIKTYGEISIFMKNNTDFCRSIPLKRMSWRLNFNSNREIISTLDLNYVHNLNYLAISKWTDKFVEIIPSICQKVFVDMMDTYLRKYEMVSNTLTGV